MVCCPHPNPTVGINFIKNTDLVNFEGIKEVNKLLGLESVNIDAQKIANVNMERMKNLKT